MHFILLHSVSANKQNHPKPRESASGREVLTNKYIIFQEEHPAQDCTVEDKQQCEVKCEPLSFEAGPYITHEDVHVSNLYCYTTTFPFFQITLSNLFSAFLDKTKM